MQQQRIVVGMMDGLDPAYLKATEMPVFRRMMVDGFYLQVSAVFPSVTNVNNVSICCGAWPAEHGITGNSYFDQETCRAEYMNSADLIRVPTLFQRAAQHGVQSALLTSKRKTVELFRYGTAVGIAAERPTDELVRRYGQPADIYSREINYWLWSVAVDLLKTRPELGLIYVHTTDYPMHAWGPERAESKEHLERLDALLGEACDAAPDAAFFLTADHGMNYKRRCWDLARICREQGPPLRFALSPERDFYIQHHRNYAGCAFLWLNAAGDAPAVIETLRRLEGVEEVLPSTIAAERFHLVRERIGDLVVFGDQDTVFGDLEHSAYEELPASYRNHGSLHEMQVPLAIYNYQRPLPPAEEFRANKDLTRFLYR